MFSGINVGERYNKFYRKWNNKNLFETNFFKNVSVVFENNLVSIIVDEAPLIDKIIFRGLKAKKIEKKIRDNLKLKSRSSYNKFQLSQEIKTIESYLKIQAIIFLKLNTYWRL